MISVLYVEDNVEIGEWVERELVESGMTVTWLKSGDEAVSLAENHELVILDVMLPGIDGFTVGQRIKNKYADKPLIMLTALGAVEDKVQGLGFADDYLTKPFSMEELIARINMLMRRQGQGQRQNEMIEIEHLKVYLNEHQVFEGKNDDEIRLTAKELKIFFFLLENKNQILTKEQIYEAVWNESYIPGDKSINVHIRHLREKIEDDSSQPKIIETIRGIGYRVRL
ncbi:response regulator transcription factor [Jeotgalicoccus sp. ATCC 8456]|uniref:response regulator transcription factor n=1 Tax=Jeotgalicoccus sp. ATCC 8456 TaxID=946435 RepID=UPI0018E63DC6|nr:response regulator transcription factor [Jeotgalicoccus sp. ATCC 8456]QQD84921.1 response regulator transcription factor [Jeotgalicoccus sp. ATCC 8456]